MPIYLQSLRGGKQIGRFLDESGRLRYAHLPCRYDFKTADLKTDQTYNLPEDHQGISNAYAVVWLRHPVHHGGDITTQHIELRRHNQSG